MEATVSTMTIDLQDIPCAFKKTACVAERRRMLDEPHIAPLTAYVERLRIQHPDWEFQEFDPLDGGLMLICCSCLKSLGL